MDDDEIRRVVQAARILLRWDAARFAQGVGVHETTVRRIEAGVQVGAETKAGVIARLPGIGVVVTLGGPADPVTLAVGLARGAEVAPPPAASAHTKPGSRQKAAPRATSGGTDGSGGKD